MLKFILVSKFNHRLRFYFSLTKEETMKRKFLVDGNNVRVVKFNDATTLKNLPPKVYTAQFDQMVGFYLSVSVDKFVIPNKIYGKAQIDRINKCLLSYKDRTTSTGVLLTGDKGTGKTLFMAVLANKFITELGLPVIKMQEPFTGGDFVSFIEDIGECCIIFDEFGKMYTHKDATSPSSKPSQAELLSLLDGTNKTKRMFIMTENYEFDIHHCLINRPSRILYHFKYNKLDEDSIEGYMKDKKVETSVIEDVIAFSRRVRIFSFDMLQTIVEEHLRFSIPVKELLRDLNIEKASDTTEGCKVVQLHNKRTGNTYKIEGQPVIHYDKYDVTNAALSVIKPPKGVQGHDEWDFPDDSVLYFEFDTQLVYNEGDAMVFDTPDVILTAVKVVEVATNYSKYV